MKSLVALILSLFAAAQAGAQEPQPPQDRPAPPAAAATASEPKPYDKVISKEAKTRRGVFVVHQIKDKWYYEIPKTELNKEFLWVSQIARNTLGSGYGGQALGSRVVRWERVNNKVLLREVKYGVVADPKKPIAQAVKASNTDTILMAFNVESFSPEEAPVIDVTRLFTTDMFEISARSFLRATSMDASRSFIERVSAFPINLEVETTHTYTAQPSPAGGMAAPASPFGGGMRPGSATVVLHYSMVKLPEQPMKPRILDDRVGYFSVSQIDYGRDEHKAPEVSYIARYRLDKKDPAAAVSEPVKPIVYYVDPATPPKWIPYVKRGIEKWQVAFEAAGFRKAIVARDPPSREEDPEWSPEDARYSVVRWLPSTIENAMGPHIHDPRTGEILEADVSIFHNVMNLASAWYFLQAGPLDPRAQKLPLPDALMGDLLEYVVAHEIGHTLGFPHNFKASSMYPQERVRDREWVKKMGHVPSIMDYSRFNYVAQPEDKIDAADLIPGIGPYDIWATTWGYKPIPSAVTPDDEKTTLDEWAREQEKTPWLRYNSAASRGADPGELSEAVGDADAVKSTELGVKNLERVANMLLSATTTRRGEPFDDLQEMYSRMLGQWSLEMNHVAAIVGGFDSQQKHVGQAGVIYTPISRERQTSAVKFLNESAFITPAFFVKPEILRRIEPTGVIDRIRTAQRGVLNNLISNARIARLVEQEALDPKGAYAPTEFLAAVRRGVFSELEGTAPVKVDAFRRNLHRSFMDLINDRLNRPASGPATATDDVRPFFRGELKSLNASVTAAIPRASDRPTRLHLEDLKDQIAKVLDPKFAPPAAGATPVMPRAFAFDDEWFRPTTCWPDYKIPGPNPRN